MLEARFTVPGPAVPAQRMTRRSKWTARSRRSLDYQEAVAWAARAAKVPVFEGPVELSLRFVFPNRRHGDLSNLVKAVEDGLQYAGVIPNDRQVISYGRCAIEYGSDPRTEVKIRALTMRQEGETG